MERCAKAAELARQYPDSLILPTGSFGKHFNTSDRPHGELLREHLTKNLKILPCQVLPHTNTSNTLEDVGAVRKLAVDRGTKTLALVTSSFHMPRVQYISRRMLPERNLQFYASDAADAHQDEMHGERKKLEDLKKNWIDVPLYEALPGRSGFPVSVYQNASREQKHYDFVQYLLITGMFLSFAFPLTLEGSRIGLGRWEFVSSLLSAVFVALFFALYWRAARFARHARQIMARIENDYAQPGFSLNYGRQPTGWLGFRPVVWLLALLMVLAQVGRAWLLYPHCSSPQPLSHFLQ
jgi:hypothetical protein